MHRCTIHVSQHTTKHPSGTLRSIHDFFVQLQYSPLLFKFPLNNLNQVVDLPEKNGAVYPFFLTKKEERNVMVTINRYVISCIFLCILFACGNVICVSLE